MKGVAAAVLAPAAVPANALATIASAASSVRSRTPHEFQQSSARQDWAVPYSASVLPAGVRSRFVDSANGAIMHTLEAGFETRGRPGVLLLHGFPELAYSWRKVMPSLAAAGYHVMAPDMRGYGTDDGMGRQVRRRPGAVPRAQSHEGHARVGFGLRPPIGRCSRWPRRRSRGSPAGARSRDPTSSAPSC